MADHWRGPNKDGDPTRDLLTDVWIGPAVALLFALAVIGLAMWLR